MPRQKSETGANVWIICGKRREVYKQKRTRYDGFRHVADVSAEKEKAEPDARFSLPYAPPGRQGGSLASPRKGPAESHGAPRAMIPRKARLPVSSFSGSRNAAVRLAAGTAKYARNGTARNRIGIIISKAVDRRATVRHAIKREIARAALAVPARGFDLLIIVSPEMGKLPGTKRREAAQNLAGEIAKRLS